MSDIIGLKYWNVDKRPDGVATYYTQNNNPTEEILRKDNETSSWFETCGPTAAINILACRGDKITINCPGKYKPQPEALLSQYFHDPYNYEKLKNVRNLNPKKWMGNRVAQWYSVAIPDVFDVRCRFRWEKEIEKLKEHLSKNIGVMVCLKNPSHYIAIIAFNTKNGYIIYHDSWIGNWWPIRLKNQSYNKRRMLLNEYINNVDNYCILIGG